MLQAATFATICARIFAGDFARQRCNQRDVVHEKHEKARKGAVEGSAEAAASGTSGGRSMASRRRFPGRNTPPTPASTAARPFPCRHESRTPPPRRCPPPPPSLGNRHPP